VPLGVLPSKTEVFMQINTERGVVEVLGHNDGTAYEIANAFGGVLARAQSYGQNRIVLQERNDAVNQPAVYAHPALVEHYKQRCDSMPARDGKRYNADDGFALARQLEFVRARVLETVYPGFNMLRLIPADTSVPVGARTHTIRRYTEKGVVQIYRGGNSYGRISLRQTEEIFPVRHFVTSCDIDLFEQMSSDFASLGVVEKAMKAANQLMQDKRNKLILAGDEASGLKGVLNYPYLRKAVSTVAYDGTASADTVIADMNRWVNFPSNANMAMFAPNRCVTSPRVRAYLMSNPRSTTTDTTIGGFWLANNGFINSIDQAHEMQAPDAAPSASYDAMLFYRDDGDSINHVQIGAAINMLPIQRDGFVDRMIFWGTTGGVTAPNVGNCILVWVLAPTV